MYVPVDGWTFCDIPFSIRWLTLLLFHWHLRLSAVNLVWVLISWFLMTWCCSDVFCARDALRWVKCDNLTIRGGRGRCVNYLVVFQLLRAFQTQLRCNFNNGRFVLCSSCRRITVSLFSGRQSQLTLSTSAAYSHALLQLVLHVRRDQHLFYICSNAEQFLRSCGNFATQFPSIDDIGSAPVWR